MLLAELHVTKRQGGLEHLGYLEIQNTGKHAQHPLYGDYVVRLGNEEAEVAGFNRRRGAWELVKEALIALAEENPALTAVLSATSQTAAPTQESSDDAAHSTGDDE